LSECNQLFVIVLVFSHLLHDDSVLKGVRFDIVLHAFAVGAGFKIIEFRLHILDVDILLLKNNE